MRSNEKLFYGTGVPAPWNNNNRKSQPTLTNASGKKGKDNATNGKGSEAKATTGGDKGEVVDATLYATWDWDRKDYRIPLPPSKKGRQSFTLPPGSDARPGASISIVTGSTAGKRKVVEKGDASKG